MKRHFAILIVTITSVAAYGASFYDASPFKFSTCPLGDFGHIPGDRSNIIERTIPVRVSLPNEELTWHRIYSVMDFNCDGKDDLLLSEDWTGKGNGGYSFHLLLGVATNDYRLVDLDIGGGRVAVERCWDFNRIWTSWHCGGGETSLSVMNIGKDGYGKVQYLGLYAGDCGTDMDNAILDTVFNSSNSVKFIEGSNGPMISTNLNRVVRISGDTSEKRDATAK